MRTLLTAVVLAVTLLHPAHGADHPGAALALQDYVGQYTLSDGRTLSVTQRRHQLVARVDGQEAVTLQALGAARFAAPGGAMALAFDQRSNGNVAGVTLTAAWQPQAAPGRPAPGPGQGSGQAQR